MAQIVDGYEGSLPPGEAAALKLLTAELACGPVVDGLMADPLTEGSRLDLLYVTDTVAADVLTATGGRDRLCRLLDEWGRIPAVR